MRSDSKLTKAELLAASPETRALLLAPIVVRPNTDKGFLAAEQDFESLMDYALGTDEGETINNALDWKRWELQDFYKKKYGWDNLG